MTPEQIIATASALLPEREDTWIAFARMLAEQCAELADEADDTGRAGRAIRENFLLTSSEPVD